MRRNNDVPKALRDVWAWKEAIYQEVKHLPTDKAISAILDMAQKAASHSEPRRRRHLRSKSSTA
jgi:hypothetical protein